MADTSAPDRFHVMTVIDALAHWRPPLCTMFLVVILLILCAVLPLWPYSAAWGFYPSAVVGVIFVCLCVVQVAVSLVS